MSLTVQRTIREQGRALFADFPETPNAGYFFSHFQESDGSTVWCRANRTARGGPVYHFVKILNPQDPENREFQVIDTSQFNLLERRQFMPFENFLLDRERELALQEMNMQSESRRRTFAVIREQQADIRQQQADIRQQHATFERQIGALEQQNATFEQQNATFEEQNAYFRASNSRKDALIAQIQTSRTPQVAVDTIGQAHTTHAASNIHRIPANAVNSHDPNGVLELSSTVLAFHPVTNQTHHISSLRNESNSQVAPLFSLTNNNSPFANQPHQQQVSQQENASTSSTSPTDSSSPITSSADGNPHTSQDNDEPSFWQNVQENISFIFAQIFSRIKQGWKQFISLF